MPGTLFAGLMPELFGWSFVPVPSYVDDDQVGSNPGELLARVLAGKQKS